MSLAPGQTLGPTRSQGSAVPFARDGHSFPMVSLRGSDPHLGLRGVPSVPTRGDEATRIVPPQSTLAILIIGCISLPALARTVRGGRHRPSRRRDFARCEARRTAISRSAGTVALWIRGATGTVRATATPCSSTVCHFLTWRHPVRSVVRCHRCAEQMEQSGGKGERRS